MTGSAVVVAHAQYASGNTQAAAETLAPHLASNPKDEEALALAADIEYDLGDYAESIRLAGAALTQDPGHFGAQARLAQALGANRQWLEARQAAEELRRRHPEFWAAHSVYALVDIEIHAVTTWTADAAREGIRLGPDEPMAHTIAGDVFLQLRHLRSAATAYREAIRLDPRNTHALHNLAVAERESAGAGRTASTFGSILASEPDVHLAARNLVSALERPLYWLRLILVAAYIITFITFGSAGRLGTSLGSNDELLLFRIVVGLVAVAVLVTIAIWLIRFARVTSGRGARLVRAAVTIDRGLGVLIALFSTSVLALVATPALQPPWIGFAFVLGAVAGVAATAISYIRLLASLGN